MIARSLVAAGLERRQGHPLHRRRPVGRERATIETLAGGNRRVLVRGGTFGCVLSNGYLTYVNQGTLFAMPFDLDRMEVQRTAVPVLDDVAYDATFGFAQVDVSRTGTLAYRRNAGGGQLIAEWLDASGHAEPLTANPGRHLWPRLSPNGERLALSVIESGATTIWIYDQLSHATTR